MEVVEVRNFGRRELGLVWAAVEDREFFASIVVDAVLQEHGLELVVGRHGRDFVLLCIARRGEEIIGEHRLRIPWPPPRDRDLIGGFVLDLYLQGLLSDLTRWRSRHLEGRARVLRGVLSRLPECRMRRADGG